MDRISGDRGHEFLQKIVQVEFHVPHAHRRAVEKVLSTGLDRFNDEDAIKSLFDQDRWRDLYVDGIANYFQNLRHVYRFLGSFGFHVAQFKSGGSFEVNPVDLIGLEALRVFEPGLYEQLPSAKRILTRDKGHVLFERITQDEVEAAVGQLLTHVPSNRQPQVRTILGGLFPPIARAFDSDEGISGHKQQWLRQHRVCHADLFDKFFALVVGEGDLSQAELDRLILLTANRSGFVAECRALLGRGLLEIAFERLDAFKEQIPMANMPALICGVCDLGEELPEPKPGLFELGPRAYAWRLIYFVLLRETDPKRRFAVLKDALTKSTGIALPADIVMLDQRTDDKKQYGHTYLVEEDDLGELKSLCAAKIQAAAANDGFWDNPHFMALLALWFRWGDKSDVRSWVAKHVQEPRDAVGLLCRLLNKSTSTGTGGTKVYHHVHLSSVEQFVDLKRLTDLTTDLKPDDLDGLERTALVEFRNALKRRADGRPDDDWKQEVL